MENIALDIRVLLQVLLSAFLTASLGWERESVGKAAGLRTHILVGVSATLFILIGESMAVSFRAYGDHIRFDAANLIGAIVTGISFLGAGMIIFKKADSEVKGLTTAAGILTTSAIGMLVGLEKYFLAVGSTAIVFIVLRFVSGIEARFISSDQPAEDETEKSND